MSLIHNQLEGQNNIYSYMHPDYWDGNRIGIDAVPCGPYVAYDHSRFVRNALGKYRDRAEIGGLRPEKKLGWGETFDANEHPPGTVIAYKRERLDVEWGIRYWSEIDRLAAPQKPSLTPNLSDYGYIRHHDWGTYEYQTNLAIVTPPSEGHQSVVSVPFFFRYALRGKTHDVIWPARQTPRVFSIGEVYGKHGWPRNGEDSAFRRRYIRILGAEIMGTYGKKQPKRILDIFGVLKPAEQA